MNDEDKKFEELSKEEQIELLDDMMATKELSIDPEVSPLSGMLFAAVVKRIIDDGWENEFAEFVKNMKEELATPDGSLDKDTKEACLVELSAAQQTGPALENGYEKTFDAIDKAGSILDVDTSVITKPKYVSRGRKLANLVTKLPKRLLIAGLVGGILFCGQPNNVLMGPKPAEASSLLTAAVSILASGITVNSNNGHFNVAYDGEYVRNKALNYMVHETVGAINDGARNIPDILKGSTKSQQEDTRTARLARKIADSQYNFSESETKTMLKGLYLLNQLNGLGANELVMSIVMLDPELTNDRLEKMCTFMSGIGEIRNDRLYADNMIGSAAKNLLSEDAKFDKDEMLIGFISNTTKVAERLVEKPGSNNYKTMMSLLYSVRTMARSIYNNPTINNMLNKIIDNQKDFSEQIEVASVVKDASMAQDETGR